MKKIKSVSVRLATSDDEHLDAYDNTKLMAVNTCPTWGITTYQMHKAISEGGRAMALEAGSAMHEVFAALRLWQLWKYDWPNQGHTVTKADHRLLFHGHRLFGEDRFQGMLDEVVIAEDDRTNCLNFCLQALYSSGFYDDPFDKKRTMSNLEEAAIMYIDRWDFKRNPIWIRDVNDPESDVGIEIAFDLVITFVLECSNDHPQAEDMTKQYRFTGKLDGLHWRDSKLVVGENKTAARLDDAWRTSFEMSSQVSGYALAGSVFTRQPISKGVVWGLAIPLPKSYDNGGLVVEYVNRPAHMLERWFSWFYHSVSTYEEFNHSPQTAPKYTHSCNRYFRSCSLIPFCTADDDEQELILSDMVHKEWSPLHDTTKSGE